MRRAIPEKPPLRVAGRPARGVGRDLQDELAATLRASYEEVVREPLPASLLALVDKLDAATRRPARKTAGRKLARAKA